MEIQALARLAQVPPRRVRYVIDQHLLPGQRGTLLPGRAGRPRSFLNHEAFAIGAAALLLEGGASRAAVTGALARLVEIPWPLPIGTGRPPTPLERATFRPRTAFEALYQIPEGPSTVRIGDEVALRLLVGAADTGWFEPRTLAGLAESFRPRVVIALDLEPLRRAINPVGGRSQPAASNRRARAAKRSPT